MIIKVKPYTLELKHSFNISYSSRKFTNVVLIKIHNGNIFGFGEASLPPYYPDTVITVLEFINKIKLKDINNIEQLINQLKEIDEIEDGNFAAKAAIDIALHDYLGKKLGLPIHKLYGIEPFDFPNTSFTIGLDSPEILKEKISEADKFKILKIKLGSEDDKRIIELIRDLTDKPLYVDINQGWGSKEYSLDMINWLSDKNIIIVEQPMKYDKYEDLKWLKERSPLPIIADEAVRRFSDIEQIKDQYHGINIKLMKCTGIFEAYRMINKSKQYGLKIMLGCMTETSCAISAAVELSSLSDYADLDGNLLILNDPFYAETEKEGKLIQNNNPGLGIQLKQELFD